MKHLKRLIQILIDEATRKATVEDIIELDSWERGRMHF